MLRLAVISNKTDRHTSSKSRSFCSSFAAKTEVEGRSWGDEKCGVVLYHGKALPWHSHYLVAIDRSILVAIDGPLNVLLTVFSKELETIVLVEGWR